jgi:hypothetical protein
LDRQPRCEHGVTIRRYGDAAVGRTLICEATRRDTRC